MANPRRKRIVVEDYEFSEAELDWARNNIDRLREMVYSNAILYRALVVVLALGFVFYFVADGINIGSIKLPEGWRTDLVYNLTYNLGTWLWASVITVFLLEVWVSYSQRRMERYLHLIEKVTGLPDTSLQTDAAKLDAILTRLDTIDHLQTEIAALKAEIQAGKSSP